MVQFGCGKTDAPPKAFVRPCSALPILVLTVLFLLLFTSPQAVAATPSVQITDQEEAWLAAHPEIRVGVMDAWPPMDFVDKNGTPQGIGVDFIHALNQRLAGKLTIVPGSFKDIYDQVAAGKLDALMDITAKEERQTFFTFTKPYVHIPHVIIGRRDGPYYAGIEDIATSVAAERGFYITKLLHEKYPGLTVKEYDNTSDALDAVSKGEADAYIGNRAVAAYLIEQELITNLKIMGKTKLSASVNSIGVRKDWPELASILDKALASLTRSEVHAIYQKWSGRPEAETGLPAPQVALTADEKKFIATHGPLRFSEVPWEPLSIIHGANTFDGLIADYLHLITQRSGLRFEFVPSTTWTKVLQKYTDGKIDMVPAMAQGDVVGRKILLSTPFVSFPLVIVSHDDVSYIRDTAELNGKKVAVGRGYTSAQYLRKNYPAINLVEVDDVRQGLLMLANGEVFAFVGHMAVAVDYLQKMGLKNLKIAGTTDFRFDHRIGIDPQHPQAIAIIDKVLAAMTPEEHRAIYQKWLRVEYKNGVDYRLVWEIALVAALVLLVILYWNRKLAGEIEGRKVAEQRIQAMAANVPGAIFQARISPFGELHFLYASQGSAEYFGLPPAELIDGSRRFALHPEDEQRFRMALKECAHRSSDLEFEGRMPTAKWLKIVARPVREKDGKILYNGLLLDITNRKLAEQQRLASDRKVTAMSQAVADALVMLDGHGKVRFWNPAAEKLFGYTAGEAMGIDFHQMAVPEKAKEQAWAGMRRFGETGQGRVIGTTIETMARNREGREFPVEITVSAFQLDAEWFAAGTVRDIRARKRAEEAIRKSEQQVKSILETANEGFWLVDNDAVTRELNTSMCAILGRSHGEILGRRIFEFVDKENEKIFRQQIEHRGKGESGAYEIAISRPDGTRVSCLFNATPLFDEKGRKVGSFAMVTDITTRKKAEMELKQYVEDLERFSNLTVDREERMIALKEETNQLLRELGRKEKYKIVDE